jgi:hypothetical protein
VDFHDVNVGELYNSLNHFQSSVGAVVRGIRSYLSQIDNVETATK